jgi:hypothetical protein
MQGEIWQLGELPQRCNGRLPEPLGLEAYLGRGGHSCTGRALQHLVHVPLLVDAIDRPESLLGVQSSNHEASGQDCREDTC